LYKGVVILVENVIVAKGKMMKKILLTTILAGALIFSGCGDDDDGVGPEEIIVLISPATTTISFGDSVEFSAEVFNTPNSTVTWYVNDISGGNDSIGAIDTTGLYISPSSYFDSVTFDMVTIKAISQADTTKSDTAIVTILDPDFVFVDSAMGNDLSGIGSIIHPFRTITKGVEKATINQTVLVGEGTYYEGEIFPLTPYKKITINGLGSDKTRIIAPSGQDIDNAAFELRYDLSVVDSLSIIGSGLSGIGIHFFSDSVSTELALRNCIIDDCYIAAVSTGPSRDVRFENNEVTNSTYGLLATDGGYFLIRNSIFDNIDSIVVKIDENDYANLGDPPDNLWGHNTFISCGQWCLYNLYQDSIFAIGNTWPAGDSASIDDLIYDDDPDESNGTSGAVIFVPFNP
jgi:hypothetical protein